MSEPRYPIAIMVTNYSTNAYSKIVFKKTLIHIKFDANYSTNAYTNIVFKKIVIHVKFDETLMRWFPNAKIQPIKLVSNKQ